MKTINDFNFKDKKALVRVDFNVPQDSELKVTDNTRIQAVKPTIDKILNEGGAVILMTHLGRPKGKISEEFSLKNILPEIEKVLPHRPPFLLIDRIIELEPMKYAVGIKNISIKIPKNAFTVVAIVVTYSIFFIFSHPLSQHILLELQQLQILHLYPL